MSEALQTDHAALALAVAEKRKSGMQYKDIAALHNISAWKLRRYLRRAVKLGLISADDIGYKEQKRPPIASDGEYNARWLERRFKRINFDPTGCWIWTGFLNEQGYPVSTHRKFGQHVHRAIYQIMHGVKLGRWDFIMHTCDETRCVNPVHLKMGTPSDNIKDSATKGRHRNARKTHCKRGHELSGDNVWLDPKAKQRHCKTCCRARMRIAAGWPEDLAYSTDVVPNGYTPVNGQWKKRRKAA
jgi:hypothetical protein